MTALFLKEPFAAAFGKNIHRLAANYWVQPIYQELLHAASGHNASVEGEEATLQWAGQNCG